MFRVDAAKSSFENIETQKSSKNNSIQSFFSNLFSSPTQTQPVSEPKSLDLRVQRSPSSPIDIPVFFRSESPIYVPGEENKSRKTPKFSPIQSPVSSFGSPCGVLFDLELSSHANKKGRKEEQLSETAQEKRVSQPLKHKVKLNQSKTTKPSITIKKR
jgi:hypothetical protein